MTNVDDLYAPHDIEEGTVIFTENDLPDAQLQRSDDPNCEIVEASVEGSDGSCMAVVARRDIKMGESFTVCVDDEE